MSDCVSSSHRSWNMSRIKSKNTGPERTVRSLLHRAGFRFTVNGSLNKSLQGKPDIVLPKYKTVIFVHGCFWHRHHGCKYAYTPKSRIEFWEEKFRQNVERDGKTVQLLKESGWHSFLVWECELKNDHADILARFQEFLKRHPNV